MQDRPVSYVGRFAPSPSGALHLGSLTTAVASFLHARQLGGEWLVRIDDIDPPREVAGSADRILRCLEALDLHWDRSVLYQSSRIDAYRSAMQRLLAVQLAFRCCCTRKQLRDKQQQRLRYPGTCRARAEFSGPTSVRVRVHTGEDVFEDGLQGIIRTQLENTEGDYVIFRSDGLPAYHLAAVLDDHEQGVTTVVRGVDLLESTSVHRHLQQTLGLPSPEYFHLPVLVNATGQKLSKRTGAREIDVSDPSKIAQTVLARLGIQVPASLTAAPAALLWDWAGNHWDIGALKGLNSIIETGGAFVEMRPRPD